MSDEPSPKVEGNLGVTLNDATINATGQIDIRAELVRIDRDRAETQKLIAEQGKLLAEGRKFNRDPWFLVIGAIIAGIATRLPEILHAFGLRQ